MYINLNLKRIAVVGVLSISVFLYTGCAKKIKSLDTGMVDESESSTAKDTVEEEKMDTGARGRILESDTTSKVPDLGDSRGKTSSSDEGRSRNLLSEPIDDESLSLGDIYFDYDAASMTEKGRDVVLNNVQKMLDNKELTVRIEGHCDERGTNEYNLSLGDRRANVVKNYMATLGVDPTRIRTISFGEERPVCSTTNEICWGKNRRAHFVIVK